MPTTWVTCAIKESLNICFLTVNSNVNSKGCLWQTNYFIRLKSITVCKMNKHFQHINNVESNCSEGTSCYKNKLLYLLAYPHSFFNSKPMKIWGSTGRKFFWNTYEAKKKLSSCKWGFSHQQATNYNLWEVLIKSYLNNNTIGSTQSKIHLQTMKPLSPASSRGDPWCNQKVLPQPVGISQF